MAVDISAWTNELRVKVAGLTLDVAELEIKAAIREFYNKSGLWVETLEGLGTTAAVNTLDLSAAAVLDGHDATVLYVGYIKYDSLYLKAQHQLDSTLVGSTPTQFYMNQAGVARLIPTPAATVANIIKAEVILAPAFTTDVAPDDAGNVWFDEILDGILGKIYLHPGKLYTNPASAQYHLRRFRQGIATARDTARRRYTRTENSWVFPAWA